MTTANSGSRGLVLPSAYTAFLRGQIAYNEGDFEAARRSFQRALRSDPTSSYVQVWIARAELGRDRIEEARAAVDRALESDGCSEFAFCVAAEILAHEGDIEGAVRSLRRAIDCEPRQPDAYYQLAALFESEGQPRRAEELYGQLIEITPERGRPRAELARLLQARGARGEAMQQLVALLELDPWRSEAVVQLARLELDRGQTRTARSLLLPVISRDPGDVSARRVMIRVLIAAGNRRDAARYLGGLHIEDGDLPQLVQVVELALRAGDYERAEEEAQRLLALDGSHPVGRQGLAEALRFQGQLGELQEFAGSIAEGSAAWQQVRRQLALALWESEQIDGARALLEETLRVAPEASECRQSLARLLEAEGRVDDAERTLRQGTTSADRLALARFYLDHGQPAEAAAALDESEPDDDAELELLRVILATRVALREGEELEASAERVNAARQSAPLNAELLALQGQLMSQLEEEDAGLRALVAAGRLRPDDADILARHALVAARLGRRDEAQELAHRALRLAPAPVWRDELRGLIAAAGDDAAQDRD